MKNFTKKTAAVLVLAFILFGTIQKTSANYNEQHIMVLAKDNLVGGWEYTVEGAPEGYGSGLIMIVKAGDTYKVQLQLANGAVNGTDVAVKGNNITFKLMLEGEDVLVDLTAKGGEISGTSTSTSGTYSIKGVKSISPK